jgi:hypothetical protein
MINVKTLSVVIVLSAAVATPVFAKGHGRALDRYRGAYNQLSAPADAIPDTQAGRNIESFGFRSPMGGGAWLHPGDLRPSGS